MNEMITYFVYISLLIVVLLFVGLGSRKSSAYNLSFSESHLFHTNIYNLIAVLIISLIVGFRFEVGVDWKVYVAYFESIKELSSYISYSDQPLELGFFLINKWIGVLGGDFQLMFLVVAFISWYLIFQSLPSRYLPLLVFFFFVDGHFFWSMNGVRQFVAIGIWLFSIKYIISKDLKKYTFSIFLAFLFHKSVVIFFPLFFVPYKKFKKNYIWLILYASSFLIGSSGYLKNLVESAVIWLGERTAVFSSYLYYIDKEIFVVNESILPGFGFYFKLFVNIFIILASKKVIEENPKSVVYFSLFFVGAIIFNISYNLALIGRLNIYFLIIRPIVLSLVVKQFWNTYKNKVLILFFCGIYVLIFLNEIYSSANLCSPYQIAF